MKKKIILIIGLRRKCYEAALRLGYDVVLWGGEPLTKSRKKNLQGFYEESYEKNNNGLTDETKAFLKQHSIFRVIANSEETVILGALVRQFLGLKTLAIDVTQRFHDKFVMKTLAQKADIPITNFRLIKKETTSDDLIQALGLPIVVKPVDGAGAQDVCVCKSREELSENMKIGQLAESYVEGSELSVETFIENGNPIFHNFTEYLHQWKKSVVPANIDKELRNKIIEINDRVIKVFGVDRGMTHAEFYLTKNGPVFGEIAIRPPGGYYMDLIQRVYQFDTWEAYVKLCTGLPVGQLDQKPKGCAAVIMFHPGAGKIRSITGEQEVRNSMEGLFEWNFRKNNGDVILEHTNTSNEVGHALFWSEDREKLNASISFIDETFKIELEEESLSLGDYKASSSVIP